MPALFFVYIIQSKKDNSYYTGQTSDLDKRVSQHNDGLSNYTSKKMPWLLVYFECFDTRVAALQRERALKKWKNSSKYFMLITGWRCNFENNLG